MASPKEKKMHDKPYEDPHHCEYFYLHPQYDAMPLIQKDVSAQRRVLIWFEVPSHEIGQDSSIKAWRNAMQVSNNYILIKIIIKFAL